MLKARLFLVSAALATLAVGCRESPVATEPGGIAPRFDGQTLGSGHRVDSTTATEAGATMATDSGSTAFGGQTLGSGH
jgi:hypothetical protein